MSLFGKHGVFDDIGRFAGKAARNPVVQGVVGATLSPWAAAALGAAGRATQPGANFGDIATSGVTGLASGYAGKGLKGLLPGGGGTSSLPGTVADVADKEGFFAAATPSAAPAPASLSSHLPSLSSVGHGASRVGGFIEKHPNAVGMGLQGISSLLGPGADLADTEAESARYDLEQRKRRSHSLGQFLQSPYFTGGGNG